MQSLAEFLASGQPPAEPDPRPVYISVKAFCRGILSSREYRQSVVDRVILGTLPPAVECRMYEYAYGKPVERVEVKDTTAPLEKLTAEELEERALQLANLARQLRRQDAAEAPADEDGASVH